MISVDFTSRPLMPMASALTSSAFSIISGTDDLDAEVVHLVAVVGEDDVDQVLADVVHVALDRGEHDAALAATAFDLLHVRLEIGDGRLHGLGRLQHERQLHLARAEQLAHHLHAGEQHVVDDAEGGRARGERLVEVGLEAVAVAVDDALAEAVLDGPVGAVLLLDRGLHVGEDVEQLVQRVVLGSPSESAPAAPRRS